MCVVRAIFIAFTNNTKLADTEQGQPNFADDTSIFIAGNSVNAVQRKTSETINKLSEWFESNRLIINKEKTIAI
jgi:hypothetical protein